MENIDDLSVETREAIWYNTEDYKLIRRREKSLMKRVSQQRRQQQRAEQENLMASCQQSPSLIHKVLALETREERDQRCQTIREVQLIVLCEQSAQSSECLAQLYARLTSPCVLEARDRGLTVEVVLRNLKLVEEQQQQAPSSVQLEHGASESRWSADCGGNDACNTTAHVRKRSFDWTPSSSPTGMSPTCVMRRPPTTLPLDVVETAVQVTHHEVTATMTDVAPQEPPLYLTPPPPLSTTSSSSSFESYSMMEQ